MNIQKLAEASREEIDSLTFWDVYLENGELWETIAVKFIRKSAGYVPDDLLDDIKGEFRVLMTDAIRAILDSYRDYEAPRLAKVISMTASRIMKTSLITKFYKSLSSSMSFGVDGERMNYISHESVAVFANSCRDSDEMPTPFGVDPQTAIEVCHQQNQTKEKRSQWMENVRSILTPTQHQIMRMRIVDELSPREIAEVSGRHVSTVRTSLQLSRNKLQQTYGILPEVAA